jgi:hypothetical protein
MRLLLLFAAVWIIPLIAMAIDGPSAPALVFLMVAFCLWLYAGSAAASGAWPHWHGRRHRH